MFNVEYHDERAPSEPIGLMTMWSSGTPSISTTSTISEATWTCRSVATRELFRNTVYLTGGGDEQFDHIVQLMMRRSFMHLWKDQHGISVATTA